MNRRRFVAVGMAGTVAGFAGGGNAQPAWQEIVDPSGRFRIAMPVGFRIVAHAQPTANARVYAAKVDNVFFDFTAVDFLDKKPASPEETAQHLVQMQAGMQKSWPGPLLEQQAIQLGAYQGRSFTLSVDQGRKIVMVRVYLGADGLWEQMVEVPPGERQNPAVAQFFDSLRLQ